MKKLLMILSGFAAAAALVFTFGSQVVPTAAAMDGEPMMSLPADTVQSSPGASCGGETGATCSNLYSGFAKRYGADRSSFMSCCCKHADGWSGSGMSLVQKCTK